MNLLGNLDVDARRQILDDVKRGTLKDVVQTIGSYEMTLTNVGALIERVCALLEGGVAPSTDEMGRIRVMVQRARAMTRPINDARPAAQIGQPKDDTTLDVFEQGHE
jgi:hypothetical protein